MVTTRDSDLPFVGQIFESTIFRKFVSDYLKNDGIYGISYYINYIGCNVWDFD